MAGPSRIFLSPPHLSGTESKLIADAIASNWIAPLGPDVDAFEREMSAYLGGGHCVALSSGTAAIHLGLKLLGVGEGDHVLCSSLTFVASANPILYENATPIFVDADPRTGNMSVTGLESALGWCRENGIKPKAAVVVGLYGQPAEMHTLVSMFRAEGIRVLEDAAESLGAEYRGTKSGLLGDIGILSFNGNKIITTSGGGMLVAGTRADADKVRFWSTQAREAVRHYEHREIGFNYRMSNLLAALGRGQLAVLNERADKRRLIFERYRSAFQHLPLRTLEELPGTRASRWLTVVILEPKSGVDPLAIIEALDAENIEARPVWKPLHSQPLFEGCRYFSHGETESASDYLFQNGICLPSGSSLDDASQDRVIDTVLKVFETASQASSVVVKSPDAHDAPSEIFIRRGEPLPPELSGKTVL